MTVERTIVRPMFRMTLGDEKIAFGRSPKLEDVGCDAVLGFIDQGNLSDEDYVSLCRTAVLLSLSPDEILNVKSLGSNRIRIYARNANEKFVCGSQDLLKGESVSIKAKGADVAVCLWGRECVSGFMLFGGLIDGTRDIYAFRISNVENWPDLNNYELDTMALH